MITFNNFKSHFIFMSSGEDNKSVLDIAKEKLAEVFESTTPKEEELKEEVWEDLSKIYYKYNDAIQKQAFREVFQEIAHKINTNNWKLVYSKLYRLAKGSD